MEPNVPRAPRSRRIHDWRDARGLVIEGHVVARSAGDARAQATQPRWGAALDAVAALAPASPRLARLALPAGLTLAALATFALLPGEPARHGSAEPAVRVAASVVVR